SRVRTDPGGVMGTRGYRAPEQLCGEPVDARADIFALGCVLFEMLTGERPFDRESVAETVVAVLREEPEGLQAMAGAGGARRVPPAFIRLVSHCLEKRPEERFQSARDLAFQLEVLASEGSGTVTGPTAVADVVPVRRRWSAGASALLAALAVGLLIGGLIGGWIVARRQP